MSGSRHQPRVLVTAASGHGSTTEIARVIGLTLADRQLAVDIVPPAVVDSVEGYDAVIMGSAVYGGHWLTPAKNLAIQFHDSLAARPVWLFSSGPVGDACGELVHSTDPEPADVTRIRQAIGARDHRMFAGKVDPQALSAAQRASLLVHHRMGGDSRDWTVIAQWADSIAADLKRAPAPAEPTRP
jgi:menaquinone-dependent protoporphyrinogen oxidase